MYYVIPDDEAGVHGYIRATDESGKDYAHTISHFYPIQLLIATDGFRYVLTALFKCSKTPQIKPRL